MSEQNKQAAGGAYVVTLYNDMENLSWNHASYVNLLTRLKVNYGLDELEKDKMDISQDELVELETAVNNIRALVIRTYVKVVALKEIVPEFKENEAKLKESKEKIVAKLIPLNRDVEEYVVTINAMFVSGVVGELLSKAFESAIG